MRRGLFYLLAISFLWALVGLGCNASSNTFPDGNGGAAASGANGTGNVANGGTGAVGGCMLCGGGGPGGANPGDIVISPQDVQLTVTDGNVPTQAFTATMNGQDITAQVVWTYDKASVGLMTGPVFTPTGQVGGAGTLTAMYDVNTGTTGVSVIVQHVVNPGNVDPNPFNNPAGADPSMQIVYPFSETVLPLRVLSPDVQWNGAGGSDVYRLRMSSTYIQYTEYFTGSNHHIVPQAQWENIQFSGMGPVSDPLTVELARMSGATAYQPKSLVLRIAQGIVYGSIYYWELPDQCGTSNGRILRIKPSSEVADEFFPYNGQCWGCHTVSRDGGKLAAEFDAGNGPLYTLNLQLDPVNWGDINSGATAGSFIFSAFDNTGNRLLASDNTSFSPAAAPLKVVDAVNRNIINQNAMGSGCGEPAWSPDGTKIAGICNLSGGGWIFDATGGNLAIANIDAASNVSGQQILVPQGALPGRPAYPTFSPDGQYIAYGRPTYGSRSIADGTLWLVGVANGNAAQLTTADYNDTRNFNPVFAAKSAGGYMWMVFISRRDYGNQLVGAARQQLWIAAVDDPPTANDPSHPPFYLRGQESCGKSENAYYALDPCKAIGESCMSGIECCNGSCLFDTATQTYICKEPPDPNECIHLGNACQQSADCCNYPEVTCYQGFCQTPPPR